MAWANSDLSLRVRQSFGVWIVAENAEERVWQRLEVTHRSQVLILNDTTLSPANKVLIDSATIFFSQILHHLNDYEKKTAEVLQIPEILHG